MCWSIEASAILAGSGLGMTAYLIKAGEKPALWVSLLYLTLIELLQTTTYLYIHQCTLPMNHILSFLGYAHIALQPLFINIAALYFIPEAVKKKIAMYVYMVSAMAAIPFMLNAYPFKDSSLCTIGLETICVPFACSHQGSWYLSWWGVTNNLATDLWLAFSNQITFIGLQPLLYVLAGILLPILYGSWRIIFAATFLGPVLANFLLSHLHAFPTFWCLYTLGMACTLCKSPLRKYLYVHHWPLYQICIPKRLLTPRIEHATKIVEQKPPVEINTITPIHSLSLPLHEFQLMVWFSGFSQPTFKTMNVVSRKRFQGQMNKIALDAALQLVLQKQEIFSYHIHRFYPLQTLCTRPSLHFRQVIEISLLELPDDIIETYLQQKYEHLYYEKTWRVNHPWLCIQVYDLKNNQVEIQVCMSQLIADDHSMDLFFRELSNAYLFFTHQTHSYTLDSFQSYQHYITQKNKLMQQHSQTDEVFWQQYLQDTSLLQVPEQYLSAQPDCVTIQLPLTAAWVLKLQQFCSKHHVEPQEALCAATSLALLKCYDPASPALPTHLCISSIQSARNDSHYANTIGCFLRMIILKLDLRHAPNFISMAKQAHQSMQETANHQQASGLVKLAALGQVSKVKKPLTQLFLGTGLTIAAKCFPQWQLNSSIIRAYKNIVLAKRDKQFLLSVNMHQDFLPNTSTENQPPLFGLTKQAIPSQNPPMQGLHYVLNIVFHRNNDQNIPYIAIVGNLNPEFKMKLGKTLISIIQKAIRG